MTAGSPAPSLRALLAGSVDYAGLFPPARLGLGQALENYADYIRGDDAWMLSRFVLPTGQMPEAGPLLAGLFDFTYPLWVSALGAKTTSAAGFLESFRGSLAELVSFRAAHGKEAAVDLLEVPLPPDITPAPALRALLRQAAELIDTLMPGPLTAFLEVPFTDDLPMVLQGIAEHNASLPRTSAPAPSGPSSAPGARRPPRSRRPPNSPPRSRPHGMQTSRSNSPPACTTRSAASTLPWARRCTAF